MEQWVFNAVEQLGALGVALLVVYWNRVDTKERLEQDRERSKIQITTEREDKLRMIDALNRNTEVLSKLSTLIERRSEGE